MKQEDKNLLIKDLCGKLPYGVKISIPELWTSEKKIEVLNEIFKGDDGLYRVNDSGILIEYVKPYLFPISSMTEEQVNECQQIKHSYYYHDDAFILFDFYDRNHFDYRGLIEKGLAIDATGLNIY